MKKLNKLFNEEALTSFKKTHDEIAIRIQNITTTLDAQKAINKAQKESAEYKQQWEDYKRTNVSEEDSTIASPLANPNQNLGLFSPNLATLAPINTLPSLDKVQVSAETIQKCQLNWAGFRK